MQTHFIRWTAGIMGIDIYMNWKGQTKKEKEAQITGFSIVHGHVGYLREAYHGDPYATRYLVAEAFKNKSAKAKIKASVLRERLPKTLEIVKERSLKIYKQPAHEEELQSYVDFVQLAEEMEKRTGEPVTIEASY